MNDFKAEPRELIDAMKVATARVIDSGWYVLGEEVNQFEARWASTCKLPHAVGVGNGLDAIEIILRALEIGLGDEVITTPMTAFATTLAIQRSGATPVLADINPANGVLALEQVKRHITTKTRALLPVHLYGQLIDMAPWQVLCEERGLWLIEDCAQAHLAQRDDKVAGSFGIAGAYSFYPTKNLGALGDGGMIVTSDPVLATKAAELRNYGQSERYHHPRQGLNSRLDEMQAAILNVRLDWLAEFTHRRQAIANRYQAAISNPLVMPLAMPETVAQHVYHLFVVSCPERDQLAAHLKQQGIASLIHYPVPVYDQGGFSGQREALPVCALHAANCLSIPCHPQLTDGDLELVINAINSFSVS
ncbi:MAG: dTDP-4-amino-4,6-dideoxygalactose transaminase [Candidatus Azotimanducaceae bacterium]|jgi:dTDP-4-amino-4,6-dideoxygalactose transaminase